MMDPYMAGKDERDAPEKYRLATVATVEEDGLRLTFDGEEEPTEKHYKANTSVNFSVGQRVVTQRISGSYVVMFSLGAPGADAGKNQIPAGGADGQILAKDGTEDYTVKWIDAPGGIPAGGTDGQVLTKNGNTNYSVVWANVSPNVDRLMSGSNTMLLAYKTLTPSSTDFYIGTGTYPVHIRAKSIMLYYSSYKYCTLACDYNGKLTVNGTAV